MKIVYKWLISIVALLALAACDELENPDIEDLLTPGSTTESVGDALAVSDFKTSDDYKFMTVTARLLHDIGEYDLLDSTHVVARPLQQVQILPGEFANESQPVITAIDNPSRKRMNQENLKMLVIVDLSLPQTQIDAEQVAVKEIRNMFGRKGLYLAFMQGANVSETYEATDHIIDNYFVHQEPSHIYLYRSILTKLDEFMNPSTTLGNTKNKVMVILSGGKTYENDMPVDPQHYELQQELADRVPQLKHKILVYYASYAPTFDIGDELVALSSDGTESNILQYFCRDMNGLYQSSFNWHEMERDMFKDFDLDPSTFFITLENPDGKIYRGALHNLQIGFYERKSGDLIAKGSTSFVLGTSYKPVVVNGSSMLKVILGGIVTATFIFLLVWIIMQFIEPYVRYQYFKRKYVIRYSGNKMSINGLTVAEKCYLCKAPFEIGDEIVVKCRHTVHKCCWDDNEYHCPEHGRHCKDGSHYYNQHNLSDEHNALFYLKWLLVAVVAGFVSWCIFINQDHSSFGVLIDQIHTLYHKITSTTDKDSNLMFVYGTYLRDLPAFGQVVGFIVTLFLSYFTVSKRRWMYRIGEMLLRAALAGLVGCMCCLLGCIVSIIFHLTSTTFFIDWIPWVLLSYVVILAVTINTRTPIRRNFIIASCGIGVLSMLMWGFVVYNTAIDYRLSLLISFIFYAMAIAAVVAKDTPRSERYFLHVEGAIKEMDIALYKWLQNDSDRVVTIGKSVDCSIQLSWDINGKAAPVQAEIRKYKSGLRLVAVEDGVLVSNKPLASGRELWLYHGRQFTIGNTTFTYIEKDISK